MFRFSPIGSLPAARTAIMPIGKAIAETARSALSESRRLLHSEREGITLRRWSLREHSTKATVMLRKARSDKTPAQAISPSVTLRAPLQWLNRVGDPAHTE